MEAINSERHRQRYAIFLEGRAKKVLNIRREEVDRKLEVKELGINVLKRLLGQKGSKDGLLAHIIGIYARLSDTNDRNRK